MTDQAADSAVCYIRSTIDDDGKAACLMQWGPVTALLDPAVVLTTARDLMAAAAGAETDIALIDAFRHDLGADDQMLAVVLDKVRARRPMPQAKAALRIEAVAGAKTGRPYVHIARGSMKGRLDPGQARGMAVTWTSTATAAQIDVRTRYALGQWDRLTPPEIEELFDNIQQLQR